MLNEVLTCLQISAPVISFETQINKTQILLVQDSFQFLKYNKFKICQTHIMLKYNFPVNEIKFSGFNFKSGLYHSKSVSMRLKLEMLQLKAMIRPH